MAAKPDEPIYETISDYNSIDELIGKSDEKSANVIKALKNQIQAKDIRISELETENELLKNEQIKPKTRVDPISSKIETYISYDQLLTNGVESFFYGKDLQTGFYDSYQEWFGLMVSKMNKNAYIMCERSVLVKETCKDPMKG